MTRLAIDVLLALVVLSTWLGCLGFARLRSPFDRLHCAAFVNGVPGALLTVAGFVSDGISARSLKMLLITGVCLLAGAALSHATGRSLLLRGSVSATAARAAEAGQ